jgi:hypothetical protein
MNNKENIITVEGDISFTSASIIGLMNANGVKAGDIMRLIIYKGFEKLQPGIPREIHSDNYIKRIDDHTISG